MRDLKKTNSGLIWRLISAWISRFASGATLVALILAASSTARLRGQSLAWKQTSSINLNWEGVASSSDGKKLAATPFGDYIYTSTNSGSTWVQQIGSGSRYWHGIASSADGIKLVAVAGTATPSGGIYTSGNSGVTWQKTSAATNLFWIAVASSSDGMKLAAAASGGYIYTSSDSGITWTQQTGSGSTSWDSIASSADGTILVAANSYGSVYVSKNSGVSWTLVSLPFQIKGWYVACSSDGTILAAAGSGNICTSTNSGTTWTQQGSAQGAWSGIASSADGATLIAAESASAIFVSQDSGATWAQTIATNETWQAVACSTDGTKDVAVSVSPSGIWISQSKPTIAQQPQNVLSCPGDPMVLTVTASGSSPLGYQWRKNGTNLVDGNNVIGSTTSNLFLPNLSQGDGGNYDVVITNAVGSVTSSLASVDLNIRPAQVTPVVVNGFVVGVALLDGGCGYTNPPSITFSGQGGSGATANAQISNGSVTNIVMVSPGAGFPANAMAVVSPPLYPVLSIVQVFTNTPSATAIPVVTNGFIVGAVLTASGSGYTANPTISFSDSSGHGAAAYSQMGNGAVTNIVITNPGSGYSANTTINISLPPTINVFVLAANNLMPGQNYQLQVANGMNAWTPFGGIFSATNSTWTPTNFWNVANTNQMFFRLQMTQ
jgi:hypothetical protein